MFAESSFWISALRSSRVNVQSNPAARVRPPKLPHREMRVWSPKHITRFLEVARDHRLFALFYLAMFYLAIATGMRRGELLGLHWGTGTRWIWTLPPCTCGATATWSALG